MAILRSKTLGKTQIKGVEEPLNVYEVLGAGPLRTRLQVSARRGLTRFVGRQTRMDQMQRALEQAKAGHGQIVGVMGEPGLGKSRLFYEFKLLPHRAGCLVLEAYSVSHGKASPYLPVIELLKSYFQIQTQDDERKRREKVIGKVLDARPQSRRHAALSVCVARHRRPAITVAADGPADSPPADV